MRYTLFFDFKIEGEVEQSDIIGALLTLTSSYSSNYGITKLQNLGKVGKLRILKKAYEEKKVKKTMGVIEVPTDLDKADSSLLASIVEYVTRVKLFSSKFLLKSINDEEKISSTKFLNRAVEIYNTYFETDSLSPDSLKKTLFEITSSKKAVSCGDFTLGSTFHASQHTIVVEGRADVLTLSECNVTNTFALGGLDFEEQKVKEYLRPKTVTLFRDGDSGGSQIEKRLSRVVPISYYIEVPSKKSVEDLSKAEIFELIKSRRIYSQEQIK